MVPSAAKLVAKETRELLPLGLAAIAGLLVIGISNALTPGYRVVSDASQSVPVNVILASLVPIALGAIAMGHEYRHGTMSMMLSLPVTRGRLLAGKAMALGGVLAIACGLAWVVGIRTPWLWLPLAAGFCLAPWFTLLTRSELAGMVFAGAVPALFLLAGEMAAEFVYGPALTLQGHADQLRSRVFGIGTAVACALALVGTVSRFFALQALEGSGPAVLARKASSVPGHVTSRRVRGVSTALFTKELRLQALPIAAAAILGVFGSLGTILPDHADAYGALDRVSSVLQPVFVILIAVLSSALATAEERHLGIWATQVLLPVPMWKQWLVKTVVVIGFAATTGVLLSGPAISLWQSRSMFVLVLFGVVSDSQWLVTLAVASAVVSLYTSSLCRRGVTAFLVAAAASVVAMFVAQLFVGILGFPIFRFPHFFMRPTIAALGLTNGAAAALAIAVTIGAFAGWVGVVSAYALRNYRRLHTTASTVVTQILIISLVAALGLTVRLLASGVVESVFQANMARARAAETSRGQ